MLRSCLIVNTMRQSATSQHNQEAIFVISTTESCSGSSDARAGDAQSVCTYCPPRAVIDQTMFPDNFSMRNSKICRSFIVYPEAQGESVVNMRDRTSHTTNSSRTLRCARNNNHASPSINNLLMFSLKMCWLGRCRFMTSVREVPHGSALRADQLQAGAKPCAEIIMASANGSAAMSC